MKALTVKQPFASLICWGAKDVENRSQRTKFRGTIQIHAGAQWYNGYKQRGNFYPSNLITCDQRECLTIEQQSKLLRADTQLPISAIIGEVEIVGCIQDSNSVWAIPGYWHWMLENAVLYDKPIPCKGALSLWNVKPEIQLLINNQKCK